METFQYNHCHEFDLAFTNAKDFPSRAIRFFEELGGLKNIFKNFKQAARAWKDPYIPSHVFGINLPVPDRCFAAEMNERGIDTDVSIKRKYLESKTDRIIGMIHYKEMESPRAIRIARERLYELKDYELRYGWEKLLGQLGLPYKEKADSMICSGLWNDIYSKACNMSWGNAPSPLTIWNDPRGIKIIYKA